MVSRNCNRLFLLLALSISSINLSYAQVGVDRITIFQDLFMKSDLVARISIKGKRYEEIKYQDSYGREQEIISTIYSFEIIDGMKVDPELPKELVSLGGEYPDGSWEYASHATHFEIGDDVLVHLEQNSLLFDRLDPLGVQPGGQEASTFLVQETEQGLQLVPYVMKESTDDNLNARKSLKPEDGVASLESPIIDYVELKNLYQHLDKNDKGID